MTDPITQSMMQGAAGASGDKIYIDDVFSIDRWKGNSSSSRTITNGIDLAGEGGVVFIKSTDYSSNWAVGDTLIGGGYYMSCNNNDARTYNANVIKSFKSNGFEIGPDSRVNNSSYEYFSYSFRKCEKFFDIVEFTGTGSVQNIPHNLGCVPGAIIVKAYDQHSRDWNYGHRMLNNGSNPWNYRMRIDSDGDKNLWKLSR